MDDQNYEINIILCHQEKYLEAESQPVQGR